MENEPLGTVRGPRGRQTGQLKEWREMLAARGIPTDRRGRPLPIEFTVKGRNGRYYHAIKLTRFQRLKRLLRDLFKIHAWKTTSKR